MDGLLQKYYLEDGHGRVGGVYVFDSAAAADAPFESDVHASLRDAYAARDVEIERFHVTFPLHDSVEYPASA